jgi:hypothetical protein
MFGRYIARTKFYNTKFFSNMLKSWSRPNKDSFVKKIFFFKILSMVYTPPF